MDNNIKNTFNDNNLNINYQNETDIIINQYINYLVNKGIIIKQENSSSQNYIINESIKDTNSNVNSNNIYINWNKNNVIEKINNIKILKRKRFIFPQIMAHIFIEKEKKDKENKVNSYQIDKQINFKIITNNKKCLEKQLIDSISLSCFNKKKIFIIDDEIINKININSNLLKENKVLQNFADKIISIQKSNSIKMIQKAENFTIISKIKKPFEKSYIDSFYFPSKLYINNFPSVDEILDEEEEESEDKDKIDNNNINNVIRKKQLKNKLDKDNKININNINEISFYIPGNLGLFSKSNINKISKEINLSYFGYNALLNINTPNITESGSKLSNNNDDLKRININEDSEKVFKKIAHIITIEGSTPSDFISSLKELIIIGEDNNKYEVIDPDKFFNFLERKNIPITDKEKNEIIKEFGMKIEDEYQYFNYDKIEEKIYYYSKNYKGDFNDEDSMKNIKNMY